MCALLLSNSVNRSITIYSDSEAALKAILTAKTTSGLVWETMIKLQSPSIQNRVRLLWNPGHSNIEGNEMADNLAKQAATTNFKGPEPVLGLSVTTVWNTVCQWSGQEQNRKLNDTQNCRQARQFLQNHNIRHAKYAVRLSRKT